MYAASESPLTYGKKLIERDNVEPARLSRKTEFSATAYDQRSLEAPLRASWAIRTYKSAGCVTAARVSKQTKEYSSMHVLSATDSFSG